jgi:NTE family protein
MATIGLVLSGGGARTIAHLGMIKALEVLNITPVCLSGVSAGAIIGALYAAGNSPEQIMAMIKEHSSASLTRMILFPGGLFSADGLRHILQVAIGKDSFEDLKIPLFVTATDIMTGKAIVFSSGDLFNPVVGSSSIPAIFSPVKHGPYNLVDGGVLNNLPVSCIIGSCDRIIGCHVNKIQPLTKNNLSRLQVLERCFHLAIAENVESNSKLCDIVIEPELGKYGMFDTKFADQIFDAGYTATMKNSRAIAILQQSG